MGTSFSVTPEVCIHGACEFHQLQFHSEINSASRQNPI